MTPDTLEAVFDQITDLVIEWHEADRYASRAPKSLQADAREVAEERKDVVLQYLSHLMPASVA